jgi:hypothetical protein
MRALVESQAAAPWHLKLHRACSYVRGDRMRARGRDVKDAARASGAQPADRNLVE